MKCLSLSEPWASLVASGITQVETRSWRTGYRGALAIHAGKKMTRRDLDAAIRFIGDLDALPERRSSLLDAPRVTDAFADTRGRVIAICELIDVVPTDRARHRLGSVELELGDDALGRYAWLLRNARPLSAPARATGALRLWQWALPDGLVTELVEFDWADAVPGPALATS